MSTTVATIERDTEARATVLDALRGLNGRATVADIVAATGLVQARANDTLRDLLETHTGHVEVGEQGDLVYAFDPKLLTRDHVPWWRRLWNGAKRIGKVAFKVWIAVTLVFYFVLFIVLAIALLVFAMAKGGDDVDFGGDGFSPDILWLLFWAPDFRWGTPYYGQRYNRRRKVPFYKKVFAFVFGPDEPAATPESRDRQWLQLIRSRKGVVTTADAVVFSGLEEAAAKEELGRLMAAYDGDARATQDGEVVYLFGDLMVSAHGEVRAEAPKPAWKRLLPARPMTGNSKGSNALIIGMNAFNLIGVSAALAFFLAQPALVGASVWAGLVWIPLAFSLLFFGIPLVRSFAVRRENRRREEANLRRVMLAPVVDAALDDRPLAVPEMVDRVRRMLPDAKVTDAEIEAALRSLAAEFDGEAGATPEGTVTWRFPALAAQLRAGAVAREAARLEERRVGAVVYSSADDEIEAGRRELETFDRDLERSLEAPSVAWLDEFEMAGLPPPPPEPEPVRGRRRRR